MGDAACAVGRQRILERHLPAVVGRHDPVTRVGRFFVGRGHVDREEPGCDAALAHPRQVEVPVVAALAQRAAAAPGAKKRVVVAVDDRDHAGLRSRAVAAASAPANAPAAMSVPAITSVRRCEPPTTTAAVTRSTTTRAITPSARETANATSMAKTARTV